MKWAIVCLLLTTAVQAVSNEWKKENNHKDVHYNLKWDMAEPFESLQGTYHLETVNLRDFPPVLATLWSVEKDFNVVAWPPTYCQAIHICFIDPSLTAVNVLHIRKDTCKNMVRFYPAIGEVHVVLNGQEGTKGENQMNTVSFRTSKPDVNVEVFEKRFSKTSDYNAATRKSLKIPGVDGHKVLILTNSRYCFAHVSQATRQPTFQTLLHPRRYKNLNTLPLSLTSYEEKDGEYTIFEPKVASKEKDVDLLPVLQSSKIVSDSKIRQSKTCSSFRSKSLNPLKHSIGRITVDSWKMSKSVDTYNHYMQSFNIKIGKCSWLRLWISNKEKFDEYKNMKLTDTLDLFFDHQFFVGPDHNEAKPLYGDSSQIGTISIKKMEIPTQTNHIVELSYGRDRGPAFPFKEYFSMKSMFASQVYVHIIKAPECEAVLVPGSLSYRFASATRPETNLLGFSNCVHHVLEADTRLANDLQQRRDNIPYSLSNNYKGKK